jgi:hypothetical protein
MRTPQHGTQTVKTHNRTTQTNWATRTSPRLRLETHVNYNNADHPVVMRSLCCTQVKKRYRIISFWEGHQGNQLLCMCLLGVSILPRLLRFSIRFLNCPDGVVFYFYFSFSQLSYKWVAYTMFDISDYLLSYILLYWNLCQLSINWLDMHHLHTYIHYINYIYLM